MLLLVLGLAVLAGGAYAAAYAAAGDRVPRGTTVAGVDIGGKTATEAQATLVAELRPRAAEPIPVTVDGTADVIDPESAGLGVDYVATVAAAGATRSWSPAWLWSYFTGGEPVDPVIEVDDALLGRALDRLSATHGTLPRDGSVSFDKTRVVVRDPREGRALHPDEARDAVLAAYLTDGTAELTLVAQPPGIDATDVRAAVDEFANPAVSGPVTLVFGKSPVTLTPAQFTAALRLVPRDGELVPAVRRRVLTGLVDAGVGEAGQPADATVELVNGAPRVVPAKPGVKYRRTRGGRRLPPAGPADRGARRAKVLATVAEPAFSTKDARALKITERRRPADDVLPARGLPKRQHRPGRPAGQRHRAQAGRRLLAQRHRGRAHP
ncbi:MAG: hypothetical protein R2734_07780 [Nocardioides sp.]